MTDAGLAHLAGADNQHRVAGQSVRKNLLGEFHRYTADGGSTAANEGACADLFRHLKCLLERAVQRAACELRRTAEFVSFFDLASDFRLAQYHRVEAGGHTEKMPRGVEVLIKVGMGSQIGRAVTECLEK